MQPPIGATVFSLLYGLFILVIILGSARELILPFYRSDTYWTGVKNTGLLLSMATQWAAALTFCVCLLFAIVAIDLGSVGVLLLVLGPLLAVINTLRIIRFKRSQTKLEQPPHS